MLLEIYRTGHRLKTTWLVRGIECGIRIMNAKSFTAGLQAVAEHPEESGAWQRAVEGGHH